MEILLLPAVVVAIWLVLGHIRKQQFLKEYMALQHKALEKGAAVPADVRYVATVKPDWAAVNLRVGIISLVLGITGIIIGVYILPGQLTPSKDADVVAILATFWAIGLLVAAFGVGSLVGWFVIDRRRAGRAGKGAPVA